MEDFETGSESTAVESSGASTATEQAAPQNVHEALERGEQQSAPSKVADLESFERVKYAGKEFTPKELQSMMMMQSDYTRKTQEIAQRQKFIDNLDSDLENVRNNPALASKFKEIYPKEFHSYLKYVQKQEQARATSSEGDSTQTPQVDPAIMTRIERIEKDYHDRQVSAINAELDSKFKVLTTKYPFADEEKAISRAQVLLDTLQKENPGAPQSISDKQWDAIWKSTHEQGKEAAKKYYSLEVNKQKTQNLKGKDVASGGGIPGMAPKQPRSIKEATRMALEEMNQS